MATFLIDGVTTLPANGDTGWGTTLNAAINAIDNRFTWTGSEAVAKKVPASGITGTSLPATIVSSSLTSLGTLSGLTVSGTTTLSGLSTNATSFNLVNTTATTVNFAGAATTVYIGASTGTTTVKNELVVTGNLTVNGTTTTVNSTTVSVDDINIVLGDTASPTDTSANGGGITLKGSSDKTLNWVSSTAAWTSSEHVNLATGKSYYINGTSVLSSTTLGSGVVNSSLTSVGTIGTGVWQGTAVGLAYGGTGKTSAPASMANLMGYTSTATAGGTTTLTNTSSYYQQFTGTLNQTIVLPVTSTLQTGWTFHVVNNSTGTLTVNSSGGNLVISVPSQTTAMVTCIGTTLTTAADWEYGLTDFSTYTGSGSVVMATSPTLTTPTIGVATATSVNKVAITAPATSATLTIADGKTLTASNTLTFTGTDSSSVAFGTGGTVAYTGSTLAQFASTTSSQLAGVISDETGSGALVFGTSPTIATPSITTSLATGSTSFNLVNTTATTVNFAGAATTLSVGAATGTTTINNGLTVSGTTVLGPSSVVQKSTTTYTLALADQGTVLEATNAGGCTITVPVSTSINFPVGAQITVVRNTSGTVQFQADAGVTIRSDASKLFISTQYSAATLIKRATDEWYLVGNLSAS